MKAVVSGTDGVLCRASEKLISNNIEAYENTIPSMLSDRLRNSKFSGPENMQTGIAAEWEPNGNNMAGFSCRLVPGMYLSGREAQLIHNYTQNHWVGILQAGVHIRADEEFEVEIWGRTQHKPVTISIELRICGKDASQQSVTFEHVHWQRRTCRLKSPGTSNAAEFHIKVPGDTRFVIDQVHLRPAGQTHVCQEMIDAFDEFPCPVLRFPGGTVTNVYHWEHGVGPVHLRPVCDDPQFKYKVYYDFGTDEFLELCAAKNIIPLITLNLTTATPEQAAGWAAYIRDWYLSRGLAVPAAYLMFGNENYWIHEHGHMNGDMYAAQLREFVPPVRAAYPEARIMAIGEFESGSLRDDPNNQWRAAVIEKAADLFDMLVVTRYCGSGDNITIGESMSSVANCLADKEADLQRQAQTIRDAGLKATMGIVEWNYWTRASHNDHAGFYEPNDIRHCLYSAGYINAFCRMGDILEVANFYALINTMGIIHVHDGQVQFSDMVKVLNLYADALPGDVLAINTDAPQITDKQKAVNANFISKDGVMYGFLINYSPTETAEVSLENLAAISEATGIFATDILLPVTEFVPEFSKNTVKLPPMSLVRVKG